MSDLVHAAELEVLGAEVEDEEVLEDEAAPAAHELPVVEVGVEGGQGVGGAGLGLLVRVPNRVGLVEAAAHRLAEGPRLEAAAQQVCGH